MQLFKWLITEFWKNSDFAPKFSAPYNQICSLHTAAGLGTEEASKTRSESTLSQRHS